MDKIGFLLLMFGCLAADSHIILASAMVGCGLFLLLIESKRESGASRRPKHTHRKKHHKIVFLR